MLGLTKPLPAPVGPELNQQLVITLQRPIEISEQRVHKTVPALDQQGGLLTRNQHLSFMTKESDISDETADHTITACVPKPPSVTRFHTHLQQLTPPAVHNT